MCGNYLLDRYSYFGYSSTNLVGYERLYMLLKEIIVTARFNHPTARLEWFDVSKTKELLELIHQMELKHQLL